MTFTVPSQSKQTEPIIRRTERGLSVSCSRITLYDVMDSYGKHPSRYDGDPLGYVRYALPALSEEEIQAAGRYIEANRAEVEAEYQLVVEQAEARRKDWKEKNKEKIERILKQQPRPGREAAWAKLMEQKAKRLREDGSSN